MVCSLHSLQWYISNRFVGTYYESPGSPWLFNVVLHGVEEDARIEPPQRHR
jgi:hypothetical protein